MRKIYKIFLPMLFTTTITTTANCDDIDSQQLSTEPEKLHEHIPLLRTDQDMIDLSDIFESDKPDIQTKSPVLYAEIKELPPDEQKYKFLQYVTMQNFNAFKDYFIDEINKKSTQTNRKIIESYTERSIHMHLDNQELDDPNCFKDGYSICTIPNGHEEFYIQIKMPSDDMLNKISSGEIVVIMDNATENLHYFCSFGFNNTTSSTFISHGCDVYSYDEWLQYKNKDITKNIKYFSLTRREQKKFWTTPEAQEPNPIPASSMHLKKHSFSYNEETKQ